MLFRIVKERLHLGEQIKMVRATRRLTQEQLGRKINLTRSAISFIEKTGKVNHFTLLSILKALSISEDELKSISEKNILFRETGKNNYINPALEKLKAKNNLQRTEINHLKAIIKAQEKTIAVLTRKKSN